MGLFTRKKAQLVFDTEAVIELNKEEYIIGRPANEKEMNIYDKSKLKGIAIVGNKIVVGCGLATFSRTQGRLVWNKEKNTYVYENLSDRGIILINDKEIHENHALKNKEVVTLGKIDAGRHFTYLLD